MEKVTILGAGPMAVAYAKVLQALEVPFEVIGRGEASAQKFTEETGIHPQLGGFENWLSSHSGPFSKTIVAVSEEKLGIATLGLLKKGAAQILVEKPGGFMPEDVHQAAQLCAQGGSRVWVGYNRRFYSSVQKARHLIEKDGGVSSFHFEFTEWGHVIEKKICPQGVKDEWFNHNSSHVADTAFYLGGSPRQFQSFIAGSLSWHERAAKYTGAGVCTNGALFSYHANWGAPGRWSLEVLTTKNRYIFKPMEKLSVQKIGTIAIEEVPLEDALDQNFKPGLYRQVEAFLKGNSEILPTIQEQTTAIDLYSHIESGKPYIRKN